MNSNEDLTSGIENLDVNKEFCHDILEELVQVLNSKVKSWKQKYLSRQSQGERQLRHC